MCNKMVELLCNEVKKELKFRDVHDKLNVVKIWKIHQCHFSET
jgi:hypothetical protein